ncbi:carbamoyl phosphate synthase large subunit [Pyrodictium occultum]|uniref:Carbamoyl phosphate synthase large chain n=1 Tax=Pyrodictium occultum TaxID=2309 RepID=A0A0V8RU73_PYROC|nr:carbamoyl-phosphate synthase (glutamine-hydrolyzing) large subunit [Pyrodictium occultum]KSW11605.1 carbamoyl phosphate synthase large subunit [Pyrodictium occultum]
MPRRIDVRKVLVLGSGAIKIAEAAEFDYSGSQALKALREEGIETVLVNPNVATIQTSYRLADHVYLGPLKPWFVEKVIERERPDGILLGFGGQTALSLGVELHRRGVLQRYGVRVLGTQVEGIEKALSRGLFREAMVSAGLPVPPSVPARSIEEALEAAERIGYPVIVRVSFNLGGGGSLVARSRGELEKWLARAFAQSGSGEVLVERYLHHWKEIEFEVVRDQYGISVAVACLENADPMGVHTGESVVVAPCQTLTDQEYQLLRQASLRVAEAISLVGEGNVQLALNPRDSRGYYVIETNPRMSRSSALASKATGYPLAYIAAKLALGYRLDELLNRVTGRTCACFEPSLDYVVVKVPRWDLDKFDNVEKSIGSEMKSIGEVMAIGRNFAEALQKAIRMLDIGEPGVVAGPRYEEPESLESVLRRLRSREPYWPIWVAKALRLGTSVGQIYEATGIDPYFLNQIREIVEVAEALRRARPRSMEFLELLAEAKRLGFSDEQVSLLTGLSVEEVERARRSIGLERPRVRQIDTLAAEWPAATNYLYMSYSAYEDDKPITTGRPRIMVLGAGVFRIGVSVEFDWGVASFAEEARRLGYEVVVVNYNPETVSTDWDMNDKLYFEELSLERVLDIYRFEEPVGVVAFLGGQIANNLARPLEERGVRLLGTPGSSVDRAENRAKFSQLLEELGIKQPEWTAATSVEEALRFAEEAGYPVFVRPSYVLSGSAMKIAWSPEELRSYIEKAARVSPRYPVVVSKFLEGAVEAEIDAVGDSRRAVGAVIEHIEPGGVHSGDSTMVIPWFSLPDAVVREMIRVAETLNEVLGIKGPFNIQFLVKDGSVYVVELNLRASRSMPFTSKTTGYNLMRAAAEAALRGGIRYGFEAGEEGFKLLRPAGWWGVKSPQYSWQRLRGAYPGLGPEMRSTGEVAALGRSLPEALLKSWLSVQGNQLPPPGGVILVYTPTGRGRRELSEAVRLMAERGYRIYTVEGMEADGAEPLPVEQALRLIRSGSAGMIMTTDYAPDRDYAIRRLAVDLGVPVVLDARLARMLAEAISRTGLEAIEALELRDYWGPGVEAF